MNLLKKAFTPRVAFSLSEALITLTIIALVAALTIPGLKKYTERETISTQLKNGYGTLNKSLDYALASDDTIDIAKIGGDAFFTDYMIPNMNVAKECTSSDITECIPESSEQNLPFKPSHAVVLSSGYTFANNGMDFLIDANGPKEPNIADVDIYHYRLSQESMTTILSKGFDLGEMISALFDAIAPKVYAASNVDSDAWKFIPVGKAREVMENGWKIKHF